MGVQPEFDENKVSVAAPAVDVSMQVRKAAPNALELRLCRLDSDRTRCEWLHQDHLGM